MKAISRRFHAGKVAVIGAGIIGLSIAWRLAQRNISVIVFEAVEPGLGASRAAAGMLSVVAEAAPADHHFFELCQSSRKLWPRFAHELEQQGRVDLDLREHGTLLAAATEKEAEALDALARVHEADGTLRRLELGTWRGLEPHLSTDASAVYFAREDGQVDNRATVRALLNVLKTLNVEIRAPEPVSRLTTRNGQVAGLETATGQHGFDFVILATGVETNRLVEASGLESEVPSITPVRGQTIALKMDRSAPLLRHVVRGEGHYLVPRSSGVLIIGATSEAGSFDLNIDSKATEFLMEGARRLVPAVSDLPFVEAWTGLRPVTKTGFPVIGEALPGLVLALGHYRNGVLLAPITAELVAGAVTGRPDGGLTAVAAQYAPPASAL